MNFDRYATLSLFAATGAMGYAYLTRSQFYPAVVFLVTSKPALVIMGNLALLITLLFGRFTKRVFLGRLREAELEIVRDNVRYTVTETCLALTVFREEPTTRVMMCFTALLFSKVFHWLCDTRVEHVEQAQETSRLSHFRITALMFCLFVTDIALTSTSIYNVQKYGPSVELLLGFEYAVLSISIATTFVRYTLSVIDLYFVQGRWHNKSLYEMYLNLITDTIQLLIYMVFFSIVFTYYALPLHLVRQLYMSFRNVYERLRHFLRFRRVTSNLHERFANATVEELDATDKICIICREEMEAMEGLGGPKRLPCGHIFHFYCLRTWLERQLSCPTCRANIPTTAGPAESATAAAARARAAAVPVRVPEAVRAEANPVPEAARAEVNPVPEAVRAEVNPVPEAVRAEVNPVPEAVRAEANRAVQDARAEGNRVPGVPGGQTEANQVPGSMSTRAEANQVSAATRGQPDGSPVPAVPQAEAAGTDARTQQERLLGRPQGQGAQVEPRSPARSPVVEASAESVPSSSARESTAANRSVTGQFSASQTAAGVAGQLPALGGAIGSNPASATGSTAEPVSANFLGAAAGGPGFGLTSGTPHLQNAAHVLSGAHNVPLYAPSVAQVLQQRIEMLQLHLQVYQAQVEAANACHAAATAAMEAAEVLQPSNQRASSQQEEEVKQSEPQSQSVLRQRHSLDREAEA